MAKEAERGREDGGKRLGRIVGAGGLFEWLRVMSMSMRLPERESTRSGVAEGESHVVYMSGMRRSLAHSGARLWLLRFLQPSDSRCSKFGPITPLLVLFVLV